MKKIFLTILATFVAFGAVEAKKMSDLTVVVDPGHGGYDGDDRGLDIFPYNAVVPVDGYWESKSNLVKGLYLRDILDSLGVDVHLTRVHNTYNEIDGDDIPDEPGLTTRAYVANNLGADCFISIHSNAGLSVNYPLMIFHEGGKIDDWSGQVTTYKKENEELSNVVNDVFNTSKYSNWVDARGQINTETPGRVTGDVSLLGYSLGVLRNLHGVGMLSEGGMHEHRPQAHRLMNDDYNWLEAWYFAKALMIHFKTEDRFVTGNIAGVVYDNHNTRDKVYVYPYTHHPMLGRDKNLPINGARVELFDAAGNLVQERITDKDYNGVYVFRNLLPGIYKVKVTHDEFYVEESQVEVVADEVAYQDMPMTLKRESPLKVLSYSPKVAADSLVSCSSKIELEFNWDIDQTSFENAFSIVPAVEGYFEYSKSFTKVAFIPNVSFDKSTDYTVTIASSARTTDDVYSHPQMEEDFVFTFKTMDRDRLTVIDMYPKDNGQIHYATPTLEFRFDNTIETDLSGKLIVYDDETGATYEAAARKSTYNTLSNGYGNYVAVLNGNLTAGKTYRAVLSGELRDKESIPMVNNLEVKFTVVDAAQAKNGEVMVDFETASIFAYDVDATKGITNVTPKFALNSTKLFGSKSGRFSYNLASNRDGVVVWNYSGEEKKVVNGEKLGFHINGDFNNHELYVGVTSGTDLKYTKICDLNFRGWEYFEVPLTTLEEGYEYHLSHIKLVQVTSPITQNGAFLLDDIVKLEGSGVEDVIAESKGDALKVYPIPASDVIYVEAPAEVAQLELINIQGASVAKVSGANTLDVRSQPQGIYVLKISTQDGKVARKRVAISR